MAIRRIQPPSKSALAKKTWAAILLKANAYRMYVGLFFIYLVMLGAVSAFYLRRDVMLLRAGDMVYMDIFAPRSMALPKAEFSTEDLRAVEGAGALKARRAEGIGHVALGGMRQAFFITESAEEDAEAPAIVRVNEPHLPKDFPLEELLTVSPNTRLSIRWAAHRGLKKLYEEGVSLGAGKEPLKARLVRTGEFHDLSKTEMELALNAALAFALPNAHPDLVASIQALQAEGGGPKVEVKAGERMMRAGERLNQGEVFLLKGMGKDLTRQLTFRLIFLGLVLFVALIIFLKLANEADPHLFRTSAFFWISTVTGLFLFLSVPVAMKVKTAYIGYAVSGVLLFNVMVVGALYRQVVAALLMLFQVVLLITVFSIPARFMLPAFLVGMTGVAFLGPKMTRMDMLKLGGALAGLSVLLALLTELSLSKPLFEIARAVPVAAVSTLVGAFLAIGVLPIFEKVFSIATANTLLDLANPNHPLIRKLFTDCPGTYHHSMLMANLSEAAAEALGGDALFARVACYYHDIGKTRRPEFFTENTNPGEKSVHDNLAPSLSALVIVNHVKEGIEMGKAARLPESIIRVIPAHHGTSLVTFFFNKAKIHAGGAPVDETAFRYPGPKPKTLEEGIIMLADVCEASVRSLAHFSLKAVEDTVDRLIQGKIEDGQLDECNLTLQQLEVIRGVFVKTLCKVYHHRINYDKGLHAEIEKARAKESKEVKEVKGGGAHLASG